MKLISFPGKECKPKKGAFTARAIIIRRIVVSRICAVRKSELGDFSASCNRANRLQSDAVEDLEERTIEGTWKNVPGALF